MIRNINGKIEGWIIEGTLRALHPVDDASAAGSWIAATMRRYSRSISLENLFD
jgi:hypothetical protein